MTAEHPFLEGDEAVIRQLCFVVADLDTAIAGQVAWADSGPFTSWDASPGVFKDLTYRGEPSPFTLRYALNRQHPQIELVEPLTGPSIFHEHVDTYGHGFHHVAYWVGDLPATLKRIRGAGLEVVQECSGFGADGDGHAAFIDTRETTGSWTELVMPPARRQTPEAREKEKA
jgi:methylmalonyl-CoA/ethylmalonyl-CoA epimerase